MGKTAFVFPGQGAQYQGMGKDFYETYPVFRAVFEKASKAAEMDVKALCFEEPEKIHITEYTQTALLAVSAGILAVLKRGGDFFFGKCRVEPGRVCGPHRFWLVF